MADNVSNSNLATKADIAAVRAEIDLVRTQVTGVVTTEVTKVRAEIAENRTKAWMAVLKGLVVAAGVSALMIGLYGFIMSQIKALI